MDDFLMFNMSQLIQIEFKSIFSDRYVFFNFGQNMERIIQIIKKKMFVSQPLAQSSFDFNIVLEEKQGETFSSEPQQDDFPDDILHKDESILCYSSRGSHKKNFDQFDYILKDDYVLAAIYDGHGGPAVSLYLKQNLLKNVLYHELFQSNPTQTLYQCIHQIDEEIMQKFQETCGSTLLLVLWKKQEVYVASVGDGICYGFSEESQIFDNDKFEIAATDESTTSNRRHLSERKQSRGQMFRKKILNEAHNLEIEQQRRKVKEKGGLILRQKNSYRVNGQLNLSRSIGDRKYKQWISGIPSIKKYRHDFSHILLASDGFCKALKQVKKPEQINQIIVKPPYLKDNATFLMISKPQSFSSTISN